MLDLRVGPCYLLTEDERGNKHRIPMTPNEKGEMVGVMPKGHIATGIGYVHVEERPKYTITVTVRDVQPEATEE